MGLAPLCAIDGEPARGPLFILYRDGERHAIDCQTQIQFIANFLDLDTTSSGRGSCEGAYTGCAFPRSSSTLRFTRIELNLL